jgi:hypothetical protein
MSKVTYEDYAEAFMPYDGKAFADIPTENLEVILAYYKQAMDIDPEEAKLLYGARIPHIEDLLAERKKSET